MPPEAAPLIVVLAGGRGERLGGKKPLCSYGVTTLIETTIGRLKDQGEILINAGLKGSAVAAGLRALSFPLCFDAPEHGGRGPLSGVLSGLKIARDRGCDHVITAPCDMPQLPLDMVTRLLGARRPGDIIAFKGARDYPLCALWPVEVMAALEQALKSVTPMEGLRVMGFLETQKTHWLEVSDDGAFVNINRPL